MSSQCRHNRTGIMTTGAKVLIVRGSAAVAEGRQAYLRPSPRPSRYKRCDVEGNSTTGPEIGRDDAQEPRPEPKWIESRVRAKTASQNAFNFAYCRPFSTLHGLHPLPYTEVRIVIALTVRRELGVHYSVSLASRKDSRYRL